MVGSILKLGLLVVVVGLIGVALFRPAALFDADAQAVANSVGGEVDQAAAKCVEEGSDRWRCALSGGRVHGAVYTLSIDRYGCWRAVRVARPVAAMDSPAAAEGCIGLTDLLG